MPITSPCMPSPILYARYSGASLLRRIRNTRSRRCVSPFAIRRLRKSSVVAVTTQPEGPIASLKEGGIRKEITNKKMEAEAGSREKTNWILQLGEGGTLSVLLA